MGQGSDFVHTDTVSAQLYRLNWLLRARVVEAKLHELKKNGRDPRDSDRYHYLCVREPIGMAFRRKFRDQLPKWQPWTFERVLILLGSIAGLAALAITFFRWDVLTSDTATKVLVSELSVLCLGLIAWVILTSIRKPHRYAQSVFYVHYINHIVRDQIAALESGQAIDPQELLREIVDATAQCFSILTSKRCRCCIQEVRANKEVVTIVRDSVTTTQSPNQLPHRLEDNTDFSDIWYGRNGCPRFFYSKNLVKLWRAGKYRNTSFDNYGYQDTFSLFGITVVTRWTLPYKSTIVWPIRFVPEGTAWPVLNDANLQSLPVEKRPFLWGFLCVDCESRNRFDAIHAPELGAAIADATFSALHATRLNQNRGGVVNQK
jgi:hypothetical protein